MKEFVTLTLNKKPYTFRALDLDQIEQLEPQFVAAAALATVDGASLPKEAMHAVAEIACASLQCEHAGISVEQCRKLITLATLAPVIEAVRGISGLDAPAGDSGNALGNEPAR